MYEGSVIQFLELNGQIIRAYNLIIVTKIGVEPTTLLGRGEYKEVLHGVI